MEKETVKVLLAEDDENLGSLLREYLNAKNYRTQLYPDGVQALEAFQQEDFDLCIIDIMMPRMDGFTLAKEIRKLNSTTPFIFLTAKTMQEDVIEGFSLGADDYMTKPFSMEELLYRIKAILRRTSPEDEGEKNRDVFDIGKYKFDANKQLLTIDGNTRKLTTKEAELLRLLCNNKNQMLDRNYALRTIWEDDSYFNARSMDVYITKLRKYLKEDASIQILNVHGKGYKLIA
ncbi:MAG TPA: response regulator transcription factor [Bacteroidales bacterium]|nr:response regulator transcription factor [Bacteroidales bacterium]